MTLLPASPWPRPGPWANRQLALLHVAGRGQHAGRGHLYLSLNGPFLQGNQMCLWSCTTSTEDGRPANGASQLPACVPSRANVPRTGEAFEWESKRIFLALLCWVFGPNMPGIFPCNGKWTAISILNVCLFMMPHQEHMATDEAVFLPFLPLPPFLSALLTESPSLLPLTPSSLSLCLLGLTPVFKPSCSQFSNVQSYW